MKTIAIIGLGNFGYALLKHFDVKNEHILQNKYTSHSHTFELKAYERDPKVIEHLKKFRTHPTLFKSIKISPHIFFSQNLQEVVADADILILAVSSQAINEVFKKIKQHVTKPFVLVNTAKALDYQTGHRFSEIAHTIFETTPYFYALLAGGTIAKDLFKKEPLGVDLACEDVHVSGQLKTLFNSYNLSVYPTTDVTGVEYAAALKNVISILAGMIRGMGFSYGSETYVISRAADEVEELVTKKLGGKDQTFSLGSQSWGNDLWMSCTGDTRNKNFGILLGKGIPIKDALLKMKKEGKTVEGIHTIHVLPKLADLKNYPLLEFLSEFFAGKKTLKDIQKIIFNHNF